MYTAFWEVYISRDRIYLVDNTRVNWMTKYYEPNKYRGLTKVGIRAVMTVVTQAWSSLGYFENLFSKHQMSFESLSDSRILFLTYLSFLFSSHSNLSFKKLFPFPHLKR